MNQVAHFTNIRKKIIQALSYAKSNIKIAMAWFTNNELLQALLDCINNGIAVDLILMDDEINHSIGADFNLFIQKGGKLYLFPKENKFMHDKYCIIDNDTVITGSYNWTNYAEYRNCENIVISKDKALTKAFSGNFETLIKSSEACDSFEITPIMEIEEAYFRTHVSDFAQEIYSCPTSTDSSKYEKAFNCKVSEINIPLPQEIIRVKEQFEQTRQLNNPTKQKKATVVVSKINDFKYAVSKYNIGFKANLIDQGMREGLKVLISKGQALPFTVTLDSRSAKDGTDDSMTAECELYYGKTTELSECHKLNITLKLNNLPKMAEGEVKFKVIASLNEAGELTANFVCLNTKSGEKGNYTNKNLVEYRDS